MNNTLAPGTLSGLALILFASLPLTSSHAATAYAVKSGGWDSDVWSDSSGGAPVPGIRPGEGEFDAVQFRQGSIAVAVNTDIGSLSQLYLNNVGSATTLRLNPGARLDVKFLALAAGGGKSLIEINADAVVTVGDTGVRVAHAANGVGNFNVSGGDVTVSGKFIVSGKDASGTVNLSAGSLSAPLIEAGGGTAALVWTGGTLQSGGCDLDKVENTGTGILEIGGASAVDGGFIHKGSSQVYQQGPDAVMRIEIESAKSFDYFASEGPSGQVILNGTIEVNLLKGYRPRSGEQFDVISASKITDEGVRLGGDAGSAFQVQVVSGGAGQVLRLTAR